MARESGKMPRNGSRADGEVAGFARKPHQHAGGARSAIKNPNENGGVSRMVESAELNPRPQASAGSSTCLSDFFKFYLGAWPATGPALAIHLI